MGMAEGYRRIFEQQREKWGQFNRRLLASGLPEATRQDFDDSLGGQYGDVWPRTRTGWAIFVSLREKEGGLSAKDHEDIKYGLEDILISEKMKEIQVRLESGGALQDPSWPDTSPPIPADIALSQRARSILHWSSIKELGLDKDEHYNWVLSSARSEMYDIARQRGDFEKFFESLRPLYVASSASAQEPQLPADYRLIEIYIPIDALKHKSDGLDFVRYHPNFGLVHGWVSEDSYYDRGAGSYPGSRGARVKVYWPFVCLLLEDVDFRKCKEIRKQSVWRVAGDPPVILGRDKSTVASRNALSYGCRFDTKENALSFMTGSIESTFVRDTLPVVVEKYGSGFRLRFHGRPIL
jgi:hypothetical protein